MQLTGLWTLPTIQKAFPGDYGVMAWPALDAQGKPSVPVGAYGSCVSAKTRNVDAAKGYVKWLWVDQTDEAAGLRAVVTGSTSRPGRASRPRRTS